MILFVLAAAALNYIIWQISLNRTFRNPSNLPNYSTAIIFGTARYLKRGGYNPHYMNRIFAVTRLYKQGYIQHILVSGDNAHKSYNEPIRMYNDLRRAGIPSQSMTLDYAGFSTLDTLVRAKQVFGLKKAVLITQDWHLPRALFIASYQGIEAVGYVAKDSSFRGSLPIRVREWLARLATLGDLYLWHRKPRFLGLPEPIRIKTRIDKVFNYYQLPSLSPYLPTKTKQICQIPN